VRTKVMTESPKLDEIDADTGMTLAETKEFVLGHFEEFVNRKNLDIADVNFAPEFVDRGSDVRDLPSGPAGAKAYVGRALQRFPDRRVAVEDINAENDRVVVRNTRRMTNPESGKAMKFSAIVIWRISHRQLFERWAYLESAHPE
jgi:predicted ester cyclase